MPEFQDVGGTVSFSGRRGHEISLALSGIRVDGFYLDFEIYLYLLEFTKNVDL